MKRAMGWTLLLTVAAAAGCEVFLPSRGGPQQPCLANDKCRAGLTCVAGTCTKLASECADDGVPCDDGDPCTSAGYCRDGVCQPGHPDRDEDGDGFVAAECGGSDCDDSNPLVNPEVPEAIAESELCGDGQDNDCDNDTDAGDSGCQQQQRFCNTDWCWYNPLPMGNHLNAAWSDGEKTWVVGDAGTIIELTEAATVPAQLDGEVKANLQGIGGCGNGIIWAVGLDGTALLYDGQGWIQQYQGSEDLFAAWCSGPDNAYLVGEYGKVLHWEDSTLKKVTVGTNSKLTGVSGSGPDDVWVVGYSGGIFHFNGSQWAPVEGSPTTANLHGVWSSAVGEAWVVGDGGAVLKCSSDSSCSMVALDTNRSFRAVSGKSGGEVWIAGAMGEIRYFDGFSWTLEDAGLGSIVLEGLAVDAQGGVTVVGQYGSIFTRSAGGQSWKRLTSGTRSNVYAIRGQGDVLLAVADKEILVFDGRVWRGAGVSAPEILQGLTASASGEFWAVGDGGTILHGSGTPLEWTTENSGTTNRLTAAWATEDGQVWAVGEKSTILRRNTQGTWEGANTGVEGEVHFNDVWAAGSAEAWAVGDRGKIYSWDDGQNSWNQVAKNRTDAALYGVWGADGVVWVVGGGSTILKIDNVTTDESPSLYPQRILYDVWGKGSDDVWVVGEHGVVLHWEGSDWREENSGADTVLRAVWCGGDEPPSCWLGGFGGAILGSTR